MAQETKDERDAARRARVIAAYELLATAGKPKTRAVARLARCCPHLATLIARAEFGEDCFVGNTGRKPSPPNPVVLDAYHRLLRETGAKPTVAEVAEAAGVSHRAAHHGVCAAKGKGAFRGPAKRGPTGHKGKATANEAEITGRILAAKANRPALVSTPKPALSLTEKAVQDYRRARKSLKRGVASYSLLSARPRSA